MAVRLMSGSGKRNLFWQTRQRFGFSPKRALSWTPAAPTQFSLSVGAHPEEGKDRQVVVLQQCKIKDTSLKPRNKPPKKKIWKYKKIHLIISRLLICAFTLKTFDRQVRENKGLKKADFKSYHQPGFRYPEFLPKRPVATEVDKLPTYYHVY